MQLQLDPQLDLKPGDEAKEVSQEHVVKKAARDIVTQIREWTGGRVATAKKRWIFELIQNAIDTARARHTPGIKIEVSSAKGVLTFCHNGGYFTLDEIDAVIYGGSTKPFAPETDYIGRFGTGFLVSHVVSKQVTIKGVIQTKNGTLCNIGLNLHRNTSSFDKISQNIEHCFDQLNQVISKADPMAAHWTEFLYVDIDNLGQEAIDVGIDELKENLPFIFAFNNIDEITINGEKHQKEEKESDGNDGFVQVGSDRVYLSQDEEKRVQIGILVRDNEIVSLSDWPKIFVAMPLTETAKYINIPFAINSTRFAPTKERDALSADSPDSIENIPTDLEMNSDILERAFELYFDLVVTLASKEDYRSLYNLTQFRLIPKDRTEGNKLWVKFNELVRDTWQKVADEIPLVNTPSGRKELAQVTFPVSQIDGAEIDPKLFNQFYALVAQLQHDLPIEEDIIVWMSLVEILNNDFPETPLKVFGLSDLRDELQGVTDENGNLPSFDDFQNELNLTNARQFFLDFYNLVDALYKEEIVGVEFIEDLLPDQTDVVSPRSGDWGKLHCEDPKEPLSDGLKDIAKKIGRNIRNELIAQDFATFNIVQEYVNEVMNIEDLLDALLKDGRNKLPDRIENWEAESTIGWLELFRWCVTHKKLVGSFKIVTKDNKSQEIGDLERHKFLIPFQQMGFDGTFENIFPDNKILHKKYFEIDEQEPASLNKTLGNYKAFVISLPIYEQEINLEYAQLKSILENDRKVSRVTHSVRANEAHISNLPFWNDVSGKIANNQELGILFFRFVIENLLKRDPSWQQQIEVICDCSDKRHSIVPSRWLASIKTASWVAVERIVEDETKLVASNATKETLEDLFAHDEDISLDKLIQTGSDQVIQFLTHLGFDNLDLQIKQYAAMKGISEDTFRQEASELLPLIGSVSSDQLEILKELIDEPDLLEEILLKGQQRLIEQPIKKDNRVIGENVELIIRKIIGDRGLDVRRIRIGGDLEIWPNNSEGWDSGQLDIPPYTVEIKFTSSSRVHLSKAQSITARTSRKNYIVLVVKNSGNLRERLKVKLDQDIPEDLVKDVTRSSHIIESLFTKLGDFPNPNEVEPDIHGYWVKKPLWGEKESIVKWLEREWPNPEVDTTLVRPVSRTPVTNSSNNISLTKNQLHVPVAINAPSKPSSNLQTVKPQRNDPCWCGSGKKYKHCHMKSDNK